MPTNLTTNYLEDAQGNKYAPVTVPSAVRWSNGDDLDDKLAAKQAVIDSSNKLPASNVSGLATVATSGSYNDLSNKPTIPDAQIQSDWNQITDTAKDYIKNKPSVFSASANGLAPAASNANKTTAESSQSKYYLCEDGKYRQLPTTAFSDTTYVFNTAYNASSNKAATMADIPSSLPASDVYSWAKASTKPTYKMSEVADISVVAISTNTTSVCTIRGSNNHGESQTIIYTNSTNSDLYVTVPTHYVTSEIMPTPSGNEIILLCPAGGYCEVNYLNVNGTIYSRGL